ncbi:hypothetical protein ZOSMA_5100G00010, partial [Zostera marina]
IRQMDVGTEYDDVQSYLADEK